MRRHLRQTPKRRPRPIVPPLKAKKAENAARRPKRVNVDFPAWVVEALDREARRLGVTRQALVKLWIAERLERPA